MVTAAHWMSFIQKSELPQTIEILALRNFLSLPGQASRPIDFSLIEDFARLVLPFNYWQENRRSLIDHTYQVLRLYAEHEAKGLLVQDLLAPLQRQIIQVQSSSDIQSLVREYHKSQDRSLRVLVQSEKSVLALILRPDQQLVARSYGSHFWIKDGVLAPIQDDLEITYSGDLSIVPSLEHRVEQGPNGRCHFQCDQNLYTGYFLKGYTLQACESFHQIPLPQLPKLFFAIKRLEQFFVDKDADPFYQNLVQSIETAIDRIKNHHSGAQQQGMQILRKAQLAREKIFWDNKLFTLLVKDLENTLGHREWDPIEHTSLLD